jgi:hypothetical protein
MEAPGASLCRRWQVVQSLAPISSSPFDSAAAGAAAGADVAESFLSAELLDELQATTAMEPISKRKNNFFIVEVVVVRG